MEKILNFCEISGSSVKKYEGKRKYVATGDILDNKIVTFEEVDYEHKPSRANQSVEIGDVIFAKMQNTKKVIIITKENVDNIYSTGFYVIKPKKNATSKFLFWLFNSKKFNSDKDKNCKGATQKAINNEGLNKISISVLPSMEKQLEIANKLDKIKEIIDIKKKQIETLDELIKSQFVEMFGDIKNNKYNWEISELQKYFDVKGGKRIPKGMSYSDAPTKHVYLRATDMKNATIIDDDIKYINEDVFKKIKRYTVETGEIYLTNVGVNLGMAGVIPEKYNGANLTENAVKLVKKTEKVNGKYLAYYINSEEAQYYINQRKMSVGVPKLAIFRIQTMPLMIPPVELQNEFVRKLELIDKQKFEIQRSLEETQKLQESLMNKYFG